MIPRTYPSTIDPVSGEAQMVVKKLTSVIGLTRWIDYIPVKYNTNETVGGTYSSAVYVDPFVTGTQAWVDHIPVYEDPTATDAWMCSDTGYIPYATAAVVAARALLTSSKAVYWRDPSDLSTLFQDSAGTTPVTAVEQPVGLMLDKRTAGQEGASTIVDPSFDNAARWTAGAGWAVTGGNAVATAVAASANIQPSGTGYTATVAEQTYKATAVVTSVTSGGFQLVIWNGSTNVATTAAITTPGTYQLIYKANNTQCRPYLTATASNTTLVAASLTQVLVPGVHFIQATPASRPILKQDSNGCYYLNYDGVDDSQASAASVDLTGTDKITVVGAWHKASDAAQGVALELSASTAANNGAFVLSFPVGASPSVGFTSKGTVAADNNVLSGHAAPVSRVISAQGSIAADQNILRANGAQIGSSSNDQGTGNYGNHTLFVGSRAGSSLRFNGREYGHALFNTTLTATELATVEAYYRAKSRAY